MVTKIWQGLSNMGVGNNKEDNPNFPEAYILVRSMTALDGKDPGRLLPAFTQPVRPLCPGRM